MIFSEAIEIGDASQRAAFLARACGNDAGLRLEIERFTEHQIAHLQLLICEKERFASALLCSRERISQHYQPRMKQAKRRD